MIRLGLSMAQLHILYTLQRNGQMTMSRLAEVLNVSLSNATGVIDRIEERGFVGRTRVPEDRRVVLIRVTPQGEHVFLEVNEMGQFLWVENGEPDCPMLRAFITLLIEHRLDTSSRLVGSDRISFAAFRESGMWERACAADEAHHTRYDALRAVSEA